MTNMYITEEQRERVNCLLTRMQWFRDNRYDITPKHAGPYLLSMQVILKQIEDKRECSEKNLTALENILRKAEEMCLPEDAHLFTYDPNWSLWG